ncbi:hypothetical protein [Kineococcus sp. SYSU DK006]|uniref:hypothetical protein n=1 Tax=Kineococcus sp. SYSU DK006 TaxID=3383127 RepID=UPI003D7D4B2A
MSSVPDFSQAPAAAAVELVGPLGEEPVTAAAPPGATAPAGSAAAAAEPGGAAAAELGADPATSSADAEPATGREAAGGLP